MSYDAALFPDPAQWLAMDEGERIHQALRYHKNLRDPHPPTPNPRAHAVIHVIVENQVALGDEVPVRATLERLIAEGLDRHDAVHAIGRVLAEHMHGIVTRPVQELDSNAPYFRALDELTADSWRHWDDAEARPERRHFKRRPRPRSR